MKDKESGSFSIILLKFLTIPLIVSGCLRVVPTSLLESGNKEGLLSLHVSLHASRHKAKNKMY